MGSGSPSGALPKLQINLAYFSSFNVISQFILHTLTILLGYPFEPRAVGGLPRHPSGRLTSLNPPPSRRPRSAHDVAHHHAMKSFDESWQVPSYLEPSSNPQCVPATVVMKIQREKKLVNRQTRSRPAGTVPGRCLENAFGCPLTGAISSYDCRADVVFHSLNQHVSTKL